MGEVIVITSGKGGVGKTTNHSQCWNRTCHDGKEGCSDRYRYRTS